MKYRQTCRGPFRWADDGLESVAATDSDDIGKSGFRGGAQSGALSRENDAHGRPVVTPADVVEVGLAVVIEAWPRLSDQARQDILTTVAPIARKQDQNLR